MYCILYIGILKTTCNHKLFMIDLILNLHYTIISHIMRHIIIFIFSKIITVHMCGTLFSVWCVYIFIYFK